MIDAYLQPTLRELVVGGTGSTAFEEMLHRIMPAAAKVELMLLTS